MKNFIGLILMSFLLTSTITAQVTPDFVLNAIEEAGVSEKVTTLESWEISESEVFGEENTPYRALVLRGENSIGNKTLTKIAINSGGIVLRIIGAESCEGDNCSWCAFADRGGCACKKVIDIMKGGSCNHSVTRSPAEIVPDGGDE